MNNLEISKDVYFDCDRKQLFYNSNNYLDEGDKSVNRYVIVREDTGKELGIQI